jgi:hypothetical protein
MKKILFVILFLISFACRAEELPTLEYAFQGLNVIDTLQTIEISKNRNFHELNPLLSYHPSKKEAIEAGVAFGLTHALATSYLQSKYSPEFVRNWEYGSLAIKGFVVAHNYAIGIRISF